MKKLLSLFGAISLLATSSASVVACGEIVLDDFKIPSFPSKEKDARKLVRAYSKRIAETELKLYQMQNDPSWKDDAASWTKYYQYAIDNDYLQFTIIREIFFCEILSLSGLSRTSIDVYAFNVNENKNEIIEIGDGVNQTLNNKNKKYTDLKYKIDKYQSKGISAEIVKDLSNFSETIEESENILKWWCENLGLEPFADNILTTEIGSLYYSETDEKIFEFVLKTKLIEANEALFLENPSYESKLQIQSKFVGDREGNCTADIDGAFLGRLLFTFEIKY